MKKLTNFFSLFSIIIFYLFLMFHIFLNIFIKSKEVKVDEKELLNKTTVSLTDRQIEIASYILEIINMDLKMEASIISKKTIKISLKKNL